MAVPKLRFPEFTDDWEQRKLGDIASSFAYGLNAAAKEFDGKHKYLRITDIDDVSRVFQDDNLTSPDADIDAADDYRLEEGDLLFARTGASVGKSYIYKESDGLVYYAGFLIRAKIRPEYDAEFVFQNTLTSTYEKYIKTTSQRSGQPGVNAKEYAEYSMSLPEYAEQVKIGMFLRKIDDAITLHQRKLEDLRILKKSMLQKMFPSEGNSVPEVRFPEFTAAWEQRKLGSISEIKTGPFGSTLHADDYVTDGIPIITTEHFKNGDLPTSKNGLPQVSDEDYKRLSSYVLNEGDIVFSRVGSVDINALVMPSQRHWLFSGRVLRVRPDMVNDPQFLHTVLETETIKADIRSRAVGQTMPSINTEILNETLVMMPQLRAEQEQIGQFFYSLNKTITLHQRKCDDLQKLKKALLQQMFC